MAIFRGTGGSGDASSNVSINQVTEKALEAEASATAAASSASSAATSATNASTSATNAASSATSASNSATASANSATTASTAATAAQTAQTAAETAETNAETAETNAETAQAAAEDAQSYAEEWATKAEDSLVSTDAGGDGSTDYSALHHAAKASASASAASTSASNASDSADAASDSADAASTSETNAATSATNAATSATNASNAQTAAESARDATLTALDSFDDRYLGVKSSDPTLDNDGNALVSGALYFNSVDNAMKVYDGSQWLEAYASGEDFLAKANNLSDLTNAATARTNLGLGTAATLDVGTGANNIVQLDGSGALPAVDGSNLTNVSSVANLNDLTDVDTTGVQDGETIVYNSGTSSWEPGTAGGNTTTFGLWEHANTISVNYSITSGNNAVAAGPITINSGITVTIPTGSRWAVI